MFGFGKKKSTARTTTKRAAASKTGKAKCTVCRQRRQVDTANKICGRHQCAKALTRRLESTKPRAEKTTTKKPATRKTLPKPATSTRGTPATSPRKKGQRTNNTSVDSIWRYRCQTLEITDALLKTGELGTTDTKAIKDIAAEARAYTFQQFATAYRTDRAHYRAMCTHVTVNLANAQTALKSVRAAQR